MQGLVKSLNKNLKNYFTEEELSNFKQLVFNTSEFYRQQRIKLIKSIKSSDLEK
jgi:hypothetical protein